MVMVTESPVRGSFAGNLTRQQVFSEKYDAGVFNYLSPWHMKGRYMDDPWVRFLKWLSPDHVVKKKPALPLNPKLKPLMKLPPEMRVIAIRRLIQQGLL